jgi:hypothetical protein
MTRDEACKAAHRLHNRAQYADKVRDWEEAS